MNMGTVYTSTGDEVNYSEPDAWDPVAPAGGPQDPYDRVIIDHEIEVDVDLHIGENLDSPQPIIVNATGKITFKEDKEWRLGTGSPAIRAYPGAQIIVEPGFKLARNDWTSPHFVQWIQGDPSLGYTSGLKMIGTEAKPIIIVGMWSTMSTVEISGAPPLIVGGFSGSEMNFEFAYLKDEAGSYGMESATLFYVDTLNEEDKIRFSAKHIDKVRSVFVTGEARRFKLDVDLDIDDIGLVMDSLVDCPSNGQTSSGNLYDTFRGTVKNVAHVKWFIASICPNASVQDILFENITLYMNSDPTGQRHPINFDWCNAPNYNNVLPRIFPDTFKIRFKNVICVKSSDGIGKPWIGVGLFTSYAVYAREGIISFEGCTIDSADVSMSENPSNGVYVYCFSKLSGTIEDSFGSPVSGVTVKGGNRYWNSDKPKDGTERFEWFETISDENGEFEALLSEVMYYGNLAMPNFDPTIPAQIMLEKSGYGYYSLSEFVPIDTIIEWSEGNKEIEPTLSIGSPYSFVAGEIGQTIQPILVVDGRGDDIVAKYMDHSDRKGTKSNLRYPIDARKTSSKLLSPGETRKFLVTLKNLNSDYQDSFNIRLAKTERMLRWITRVMAQNGCQEEYPIPTEVTPPFLITVGPAQSAEIVVEVTAPASGYESGEISSLAMIAQSELASGYDYQDVIQMVSVLPLVAYDDIVKMAEFLITDKRLTPIRAVYQAEDFVDLFIQEETETVLQDVLYRMKGFMINDYPKLREYIGQRVLWRVVKRAVELATDGGGQFDATLRVINYECERLWNLLQYPR